MSDGNFNRALLQHTPYASGLKMGRAQMRHRAVEALRVLLNERCGELSDDVRGGLVEDFATMLR